MIVVIVRDEDGIDLGERVKPDAGGIHPPRSKERKRARAFGPDRIDENVLATRLDEERRMTYVANSRARAVKARRRAIGLEGARVGIGPGHASIGQLPP